MILVICFSVLITFGLLNDCFQSASWGDKTCLAFLHNYVSLQFLRFSLWYHSCPSPPLTNYLATLTGLSTPWCCPSMIYGGLSPQLPPSAVPFSMAFSGVSYHGRTTMACNSWWLTVRSRVVWQEYSLVSLVVRYSHCHMFIIRYISIFSYFGLQFNIYRDWKWHQLVLNK